MKAAAVIGGIFAVTGWAVAAWLLLDNAGRLVPLEVELRGSAGPSPTSVAASPGVTQPGDGVRSLLEEIYRDWAADPSLAGASIGFCLLDEDGGTEFASPLASNALCPASALKTVTTAAALELLGPDFRFTTMVVSDVEITPAGVLDGDLRLSSTGDPTFSSANLEALADAVIKAGLKQVNGKLEIDGADFHEPPVNDHWNWGDIGNAYGAGAYGINLDHNRITLRFQPAAAEGQAATLLNPEITTKDTRWNNEVVTGPDGTGDRVVIYSSPFGRAITLRGSVPLGESNFAVNGALPDPPAKVEELFQAKLAAAGVKFLGRKIPMRSGIAPLAFHDSKPLPEIIDHLHKVSDNLEAQCLFLTIGRQKDADPAAAYAIRRHWESRGVEFKGLRLIDGSGLARANMIRPLDLAKVNHLARRGPQGERFRQSLTAYLDGRVRSKLGAMSGVKTDVGFITMADGRELTFCLMANGVNPELNFWTLRDKLLLAVSSADSK
ncbi:D-alanyl-D-alanine carboxypeptidase/D-alanyl-D-alanine-endopeptidase [Luteolibacter arcticus]|uniref:D-alanyl-D-alanine carboxypeptidase/D-alanyl-D-alanine-endopeptidase n=1 Tax=Luteolibacter arcticus TaxID=1581411 RepID=A0ABT3GKL3_9BACT|nr:D-alanyl-D-alanine carboxypeptidase/D-alanyl-D-alanine-endopeptidase [Luteolibacter arcticus]MCW1924060.1 D-alanyl-D-alanine carboxypeptidase/D-alanyl-D-alanine-endopeptidase [Luteolibacter arcticus]